jgi:GntR family transcriptional repressor for pyruvate dehydrogenase complex
MSGTPFVPVERRTVTDEVRDAIAESIRTGVLAPGSQLPSERDLCQQFGVARTSVREAIQGLVVVGVIERRGNRSYVVEHLPTVSFDADDLRKRRVRELFEVRQVVEVPIARLAAKRATDDQRGEISELATRFRADMRIEDFRPLDRAFHWAVAGACGNATLAEVYGKVLESLFASKDLAEMLSARSNRAVVREVIRGSVAAHRAIAESIAAADWNGVADAAEHHIDNVEDQMISKMV